MMTGYQSKRNMAQDKLAVDRAQVEQWMEALKDIDALHHPAEPEFVDAQKALDDMGQVLAQPAQERNFCPRCGKRTADLTVIHTCTPPQETTLEKIKTPTNS